MPVPRSLVLMILAVLSLAAVGCGDEKTAAGEDCGRVLFSAEPTDGAFDIKATGVACATAIEVARAADSVDVAADNIGYGFGGFVCVGTLVSAGLAYRCENEDQVVTFTRT